MIETQLHVLMGKKRVKISDVYRETGVSRSTLTKMWKGETNMIKFETLDVLCKYFNCEVGDFIKLVPDDKETKGEIKQ